MVATLAKITDAAAARSYYQVDDYWSREAAGLWQGRAVETLGLDGEVEPDQFTTLLGGDLPDGTRLGTTRQGVREHTPGWDLTMSAPKSVSVMGLVAGDRRVIDAHARAVHTAMGYVERHAGVTRIRTGDDVERIATEKLAYAQFLHVTARATEDGTPAPQIHTHNVVLNMTQDADGNWRSLDARDLYRLQKSAGAVYHMELAAELRQLGYSVTVAPDTTFEIDGIPGDVQRAFSPRSARRPPWPHAARPAPAPRRLRRASSPSIPARPSDPSIMPRLPPPGAPRPTSWVSIRPHAAPWSPQPRPTPPPGPASEPSSAWPRRTRPSPSPWPSSPSARPCSPLPISSAKPPTRPLAPPPMPIRSPPSPVPNAVRN
jgi:conjugative relaxase-like TrwC/TraI family protein